MREGEVLRAGRGGDLPALLEEVRGLDFRFDAVRHLLGARAVEIPLERKFPHRESLVLRFGRVRHMNVEGRGAQATDSVRDLRHDGKAGEVRVQGVLAALVFGVESLDAELRCLSSAAEVKAGLGDLPAPFRRDVEEERERHEGAKEVYEKDRTKALRACTGIGAVALALACLLTGNPWWVSLLGAVTGGVAGRLVVTLDLEVPAYGALLIGGPGIFLTVLGDVVRGDTATGMGAAGPALVRFVIWIFLLLIGVGLVMALESSRRNWGGGAEAEEGEKRIDGLPRERARRLAAWAALGGAGLAFVCLRSPFVWFVLAPAVTGLLAYDIFRRMPFSRTAGSLMAASGVLHLMVGGPRSGFLFLGPLGIGILYLLLLYAGGMSLVSFVHAERDLEGNTRP